MMIQKDYSEDEDGIVSEFYEYNEKSQLVSVKALMKGSSDKVIVAEYSYTPRGEIEKVTQNLSPADSGSDKLIRKYTYDMFGCVTDIEYSKKSDGKVFEKYSYTYDRNFNIISETITGETTQVCEYIYSSKGQLSYVKDVSKHDHYFYPK